MEGLGGEERIDSSSFYREYHGHPLDDLFVLEGRLREAGKKIVWLMGDSSLDNKHWLYKGSKEHCSFKDQSFCGAAVNGYEQALTSGCIRDVCYNLNVELARMGSEYVCINAAVEESTVADRQEGLLEHDSVVQNLLRHDDIIIASLGGNDIALKPTTATMLSVGVLHYLTPAFMFGDFLRKVIGNKKPALVIVCSIYYPCEKGNGWADQLLDNMLGYSKSPQKLQTMIDACHTYFTKEIKLDGIPVEALALSKVLDSKDPEDYDNRVEPSVQGGAKMGKAMAELIQKRGCKPRMMLSINPKYPPANPYTTFYKRDLPPNCVAFGGKEGRGMFKEALEAGTMDCYFSLAEQFRTQAEPAYCGLGSLVMALNALATDPKRVWKAPWRWFDEEMLDCCSPLEVIRQQGVTMSEFSCLAACNGASISSNYAEHCTEEQLREDIKRVCVKEFGEVLVVSYNRADVGQTGTGHYSPVGGYLESKDMVLILDTARFKYPPHWLKVSELFNAMKAKDPSTGRSRGWHLLTRKKDQLTLVHFPLHMASPSWKDVSTRIHAAAEKSDEALLEALMGLNLDPELSTAFPTLVPNLEEKRWHIISRLKESVAWARLPADMPEERRLVLSLVYEALSRNKASPRDKPFQEELRSVAAVFKTVEEFCCNNKDVGNEHCHCRN